MKRALAWLEAEQEADGSWFGRWGVNYVYGTWSVLCALNAAGLGPSSPMVTKAADWLTGIQNPDGGWGEGCESYKLDYAGYEPAHSAPSQTAWAVLGLMSAGRLNEPSTERGVAWLLARQSPDGAWPEDAYTGGGFPRVFYLRYHGYAKFFPLWAMARYRNLKRGNTKRVAWGM
jgi:squalene-hopene/tetraprenyl-beta-curcumene cyclase